MSNRQYVQNYARFRHYENRTIQKIAIIFSSYIYTDSTAGATPQNVSRNVNNKTGKRERVQRKWK